MLKSTENMRELLETHLDFRIENPERSSIYFVSELNKYIKQKKSPYIIIALDKAKTFNVDAVYFRFFDNERPQLAQIYIYDNITEQKSDGYYAQKHKEIWSSCEVASFFIIDKSEIRIYDCRKPAEICNNNLKSVPIETINLLFYVNDAIAKYKAQNFDNGSFWENEGTKNHFLNSKIASERLIKGLREIRNELREEKLLSTKIIDKFLIICILIKGAR